MSGAASQPNIQDEQRRAEQANRNEEESAGSAPRAGAAIKAVEQVEGAEYNRPCYENQDNRSSDLCAQWKAADSAAAAAWWAKWQTWLSVVGVAGLLYNLYLTRTATQIALDATKDADTALAIADRNANAATEQVVHAKNTAKQQLRAYVGIFKGQTDPLLKRGPITGKICSRNAGQTPAYNFRIWYNVAVYGVDEPNIFGPANSHDREGASIKLPGMEANHPIETSCSISEHDYNRLIKGDANIYVWGEMTYMDIFKKKRATSFRMKGDASVRACLKLTP